MRPERHHRQGQRDQHQAKLGRTRVEVAQFHLADDLDRQEGVDREQKVTDQRGQSDVEADIGAKPDPGDDQQRRGTVATMVDEVTERGPLDLAVARQAAVEAVAEPLDHEPDDRQPQPARTAVAERIARENHPRAGDPDPGQQVRRKPQRQPRADPCEQAPLGDGEQILLDAVDRGRGGIHPVLSAFPPRAASNCHAIVTRPAAYPARREPATRSPDCPPARP